MSVKTFRYAGVSEQNGQYKVRYANDKGRAQHLVKVGHTNVEIFDLKDAMPKEDCVDLLLSKTFKNTKAMETVIAEAREIGFKV